MATIYAVAQGEYSDYGIRAIFSTRELAEQYIQDQADPETGKQQWGEMNVEEYELDPKSEPVVWVTQYCRYIRTSDGVVLGDKDWMHRETLAPGHIRGSWSACSDWVESKLARKLVRNAVICGTSCVSMEHAHKLAVEGRQAFLRDPNNWRGEEK